MQRALELSFGRVEFRPFPLTHPAERPPSRCARILPRVTGCKIGDNETERESRLQ